MPNNNHNQRLRALADLPVRVGANVAEEQYVLATGLVEPTPPPREIPDVSYEKGARYVDVAYIDQHVRRSMIEKGSDDVLEWTPEWAVKRIDDLGDGHGAP